MEEQDLLEVRFPGGRVCLCMDAVLVLNGGTQISTDGVTVIEITGGVLSLVRSGRTTIIPLDKFRQVDFNGLIDVPTVTGKIDSARLLREHYPGGLDG